LSSALNPLDRVKSWLQNNGYVFENGKFRVKTWEDKNREKISKEKWLSEMNNKNSKLHPENTPSTTEN